MLKIRLQRVGRKKIPAFRLVVAEHTMPVKGRFLEKLGNFVLGRKKETLVLKKERILHWLAMGAKPSQTVARLLNTEGLKEFEKFIEQRKQVPSKAEQKALEEQAAKEKEEKEKTAAEVKDQEVENKDQETEKKDQEAEDSKTKEEKKIDQEVEKKEEAVPEKKEEN